MRPSPRTLHGRRRRASSAKDREPDRRAPEGPKPPESPAVPSVTTPRTRAVAPVGRRSAAGSPGTFVPRTASRETCKVDQDHSMVCCARTRRREASMHPRPRDLGDPARRVVKVRTSATAITRRAEDGADTGDGRRTTVVPDHRASARPPAPPPAARPPKGERPGAGARGTGITGRCLTWGFSSVPTPKRGGAAETIPRKEVIQPQLPLRLPCYDFVPITRPTLDGCPPANRVGPPASGVAGFRDVTGGVYKAREHIHRGTADPRLLATPTSRGRVAAPDPNWGRVWGIGSASRLGDPLSRPL